MTDFTNTPELSESTETAISYSTCYDQCLSDVYNEDCIEVMKTLPEGCIDLIVTSPPYGVGIDYDVHEDDMEFNDYVEFAKSWLTEAYKVLKDDGRIALNIPYEINLD